MTVLADLQHFPLSEAFYCPDCKHVGNSADQCACCTNKNVHPVQSWIDRPKRRKRG